QGTSAAFSLDMGKVITSGEGGIVTTDDAEVHALAAEYHDHGHENDPELPRGRDSRRIMGFNYRMTELQAAVASVQLQKLAALEWHFAGTWTHMCDVFEISEDELRETTAPSWERLARSVAVPVLVLESEEQLAGRGEKLRRIAESVLG